MTESDRPMKRLFEQANSPLERALLHAGRDVGVSDETRVAVLEAVGLQPRRRSRGRALPFGRTALLLAAMVISAAAVAIPLAERVMSGHPEPSEMSPAAAAEQPAHPDLVVPPAVPRLDAPSTIESLPLERADEPASRPANEAFTGQSRTPTGRGARALLAAELSALDAARAKLAAGDARAALGLLDAYQREFPRPRLSLEAEVLRIDALDRAGQAEAARRHAEMFVQKHPKGVLTGRVRRYLAR